MLEANSLVTALIVPVGVSVKGMIADDGFFYLDGMDRKYEVFIAEGFHSQPNKKITGHLIDIKGIKKFFKWSFTDSGEKVFEKLVFLFTELYIDGFSDVELNTLHIHTSDFTHSLSLKNGCFVGVRDCCKPALCGFSTWGNMLIDGEFESVTDSQFIPAMGKSFIIVDKECLCVVKEDDSGIVDVADNLNTCPACGEETIYEKEGICCPSLTCHALSSLLDEALISQCPQLTHEDFMKNVPTGDPIDSWVIKPVNFTTNYQVSILTLLMYMDKSLGFKVIKNLKKGNYHWILDRIEQAVCKRYGMTKLSNGCYNYYCPDPDHFIAYVHSENKQTDIYEMILTNKGYEVAKHPELVDIILFENKENTITEKEVRSLGFYNQCVISIDEHLRDM